MILVVLFHPSRCFIVSRKNPAHSFINLRIKWKDKLNDRIIWYHKLHAPLLNGDYNLLRTNEKLKTLQKFSGRPHTNFTNGILFWYILFLSENGKTRLSVSDQFAPYTLQLALYVAFYWLGNFAVYYSYINSQTTHFVFQIRAPHR